MKLYLCHLLLAGLSASTAAFTVRPGHIIANRNSVTLNAEGEESVPEVRAPKKSPPPAATPQGSLASPPGQVDIIAENDALIAGHLATIGQPQRIQGGSLRTWTFEYADRLVVSVSSDDRTLLNEPYITKKEGRLCKAIMELNEGPDNTPMRLKVYSSKGKYRPFKAIIETPGKTGSLFIYNIADLEYPITAGVGAALDQPSPGGPHLLLPESCHEMREPEMLQGGGSIMTFPLDASVKSAKVQLKTDGRPLNAKIELIQGPNEVKHMIEIYTEDGLLRPFLTIIEGPGLGNVIRVVVSIHGL